MGESTDSDSDPAVEVRVKDAAEYLFGFGTEAQLRQFFPVLMYLKTQIIRIFSTIYYWRQISMKFVQGEEKIHR